jgi:hypothetical protein
MLAGILTFCFRPCPAAIRLAEFALERTGGASPNGTCTVTCDLGNVGPQREPLYWPNPFRDRASDIFV